MLCISVVIVMLSSFLAWMYDAIKRVITNHNSWPILTNNVPLRVQPYFRSFLLHGHYYWFIGNKSNGHLNPAYCWPPTSVYCHGTRFITFSIYRGHFFLEITFEINHKDHPTQVINWVYFWSLNYFDHIFARVCSNTAQNWTATFRVDSSLAINVIFLLNVDIDTTIFLIADNRKSAVWMAIPYMVSFSDHFLFFFF